MPSEHLIIQAVIFILLIGGIFYSIILHEISHGYVAKLLGDDTAQVMGRINLNPMVHVDIYGTIILPIALFLLGLPIFGWAKPVPVNPSKMEKPRLDYFTTALAGPITNFLIAVLLSLVIRFINLGQDFNSVFYNLIQINLVLMIFNLIPIPPLDGSKFLSLFLSAKAFAYLEQFGFYILLILIMFPSQIPIIPFILNRVVGFFFTLLTGQGISLV